MYISGTCFLAAVCRLVIQRLDLGYDPAQLLLQLFNSIQVGKFLKRVLREENFSSGGSFCLGASPSIKAIYHILFNPEVMEWTSPWFFHLTLKSICPFLCCGTCIFAGKNVNANCSSFEGRMVVGRGRHIQVIWLPFRGLKLKWVGFAKTEEWYSPHLLFLARRKEEHKSAWSWHLFQPALADNLPAPEIWSWLE